MLGQNKLNIKNKYIDLLLMYTTVQKSIQVFYNAIINIYSEETVQTFIMLFWIFYSSKNPENIYHRLV